MNISGTSLSIYQSFEKKLYEVNSKELLYKLAKGLLYTFIIFLLIGFALIILELIFNFGTSVRKIFYWGFLSVSVTTLVYFISNYILKRSGIIKPPDLISYSKKVGNNFENIKDRLSNSLSLFQTYNKQGSGTVFSGDLIKADIDETNRLTQEVDLTSVISFSDLKKSFYVFLSTLLLYGMAFAVFPSDMSGALKRIVNYNFSYYENDLGISFAVTPGNAEIAKGEKVNVVIRVNSTKQGFIPDEIEFYTKQITADNYELLSDPAELKPGTDGSFKTVIENINSDLIYFASYKNIKSEEFRIKVSDYPIVRSFTVSVYPPDFTGIPSKTLEENEGDIFCPEGSRIYFEVKSNRNLSYAGIKLNNSPVDFDVSGESARGSFTARESGVYNFVLKDENGTESKNQNNYNIKVLPDKAPEIIITEPEQSNYELKGEYELLLRARITDDYGFSKLTLGYRKLKSLAGNAGAPPFIYENVTIQNPNATSVEVPYVWNIAKLNLRSGESAEYFMEVTDNSGKTVRSDIRTIKFRSLSDMLKKSEEMTKDLKTDLKSVFEQAEEMQKEIQDLKKELNKNEELGLNEDQKRQMQNKVDNFQRNLNSAQKKLEESMNEMQQKNMLSEKTLEQYMELQKMFNKINTPELQKMLEKLREALKKNNPEDLKEALKNFKFDEEAFKKYMEKAMELLKKIENMQKFGELTQKLDDITKKQEDLKKETERSDKNDKNKMNELSDKQKNIKDQTKDFTEELKKLIDEINKMKEQLSAEDLEKIRKKMEQKNTENKMQKSSDQLQKSDKSNSEQTQEDIMNDLNELNEQMKEALSEMMDSQDMQKKLLEKLKDIKKQLDELSRKQQELRDKTDELTQSDKEEFEKNQKKQKTLQSELSRTIEDLMNASKMGAMMTPEMGKELGNAYNKMDKAEKELGEKQKANASSDQGKAKESLDNASKMLADMIGKMGEQGKDGEGGKDGKKGKGGNKPGQGDMGQLMSRLGEIIAQQMGLNGKTGKVGENGEKGNNGKGNSPDNPSREQRIEMQKLSLEQQQIQKSLEQLNEELKREQERSGEKVLGDLEEVQKEMKEIVKELEENRYDDKLVEKQNRILSRMLDAQLSQREKDFEPKRESKPGDNVIRTSPPEIVLRGPNSFNELKEDFLNLQKEGFTEDYEALIAKYLMELKKSGVK